MSGLEEQNRAMVRYDAYAAQSAANQQLGRNMAVKAVQAAPPRWETPPVHPAAEMLPMMSDAELDELAADIKENGLQHPIILFRDNTAAADGSDGPFPMYLLDGRNRLEALKRLGIDDPRQAPGGHIVDSRVRTLNALQEGALIGGKTTRVTWTPNVDPQEFVMSMNVYRRHLSQTEKRAHIAALIKADPTASDRKIGRQAGVDHKTVVAVRKNVPNGEIPQTEGPVERVKCVLRNDPSLSAYAAAKAAGVGMSSSYKARDELVAAGEFPVEKPKPQPKPPVAKKKKPTAAEQAAARNAQYCTTKINEIGTLIAELDRTVTTLGSYTLTESQLQIINKQANLTRDIVANLRTLGGK